MNISTSTDRRRHSVVGELTGEVPLTDEQRMARWEPAYRAFRNQEPQTEQKELEAA